MKEHKFSRPKKNRFPVWPPKWSRQCGDFNNFGSKKQDILLSKKWNNESLKNDHKHQQIEGNQAEARKRKTFAGETSGTKSGQDAVKEGKLNRYKKCCFSSGVSLHTNTVTPSHAAKQNKLCGKKATSRLVSVNNLVHEDSASVPPKKITKARRHKDESARSLVAAKSQGNRRSPLYKERRSGGLWLLKICDLLNIGRGSSFMMQKKLFQIAACGKLQSEKLRARKTTNYRLLDFNWMWFQKGFWNCCKKTLRSRIRKVVSYLKLQLQKHIRAGRRSYDMNNNTSGILYEIPQCTTKSCLRDDVVKLQNVEAPFGNAASSIALLRDSQQPLLCTPAQWCGADTLTKKTSDNPAHNQPDDLCVLLTEKEVYISCQEETTAHGEKDDEPIPLTFDKLQHCANDTFVCQNNASMETVENGDESCPMDLDDSTDSDVFSAKLLDHPYCKSPMQQTTSEGLDILAKQGLQNGQKILRYVPDEQIASSICDFLNEVMKKYGSLIPVSENDVLTRLKEVFHQDFSHRMSHISKEMAKYRAKISRNIGCGFRIGYNKHTLYMEDLVTLDEQQWLNDQIINMYGDLIMDAAPDMIHFFNTF
ncbi:uncharacterized protein LOC142697930 [Rhinoderma darwinii]|uniref:uncharacterized protein LOC142697930 n=1 Tax=Rhinoderma darwinii TaxID=43563 RepID=UPI003F66136F